MTGMAYSGSGTNQEIDDQSSLLPGYIPYLCLVFRLVAAVVYLLMASLVVFTIKTTRSLHKPHNIYLANIVISKMIFTISGTFIAGIMMISYQLGLESPIPCYLLSHQVLPFYVSILSFVIIATDKVIVVTSPFRLI